MKYQIIPAAESGLYRLRNMETGRDVLPRPVPRVRALLVKAALEHNQSRREEARVICHEKAPAS